MGRMIDADEVKKWFPIMENDFGMVINERLHKELDKIPTVEAIPKDQYENRLKADMVVMLEDLKKEMNPIKECEYQIYGKEHWGFVGKCQDAIQQKINSLKENTDGME